MNPVSFNSYNQNRYYNQYSQVPYAQTYYGYNEPESQDNPAKTVTLAAILQGIAIGVKKMSEVFSKKLAAGKEFTNPDNVTKAAQNMINKNNLLTKVFFINPHNQGTFEALGKEMVNEVAQGRNAFFHRGFNVAVAPSSKPSLILHELGHAVNFTKPFFRTLQKMGRYAFSVPTALLIANGLFPKKNDGKQTFIERNAGILGFCAYIPTLIEEGVASVRGIKAAKSVLNNKAALNTLRKNYALAWMTYFLGAVALGIASKQTVMMDDVKTY